MQFDHTTTLWVVRSSGGSGHLSGHRSEPGATKHANTICMSDASAPDMCDCDIVINVVFVISVVVLVIVLVVVVLAIALIIDIDIALVIVLVVLFLLLTSLFV
jgi:hypothetical protein